jgi:hypothetical protein
MLQGLYLRALHHIVLLVLLYYRICSSLTMMLQSKTPPIFALCGDCYWCATYFAKDRLLSDKSCPQCRSVVNNELTLFPIISNESFTFYLNDNGSEQLKLMLRQMDGIR